MAAGRKTLAQLSVPICLETLFITVGLIILRLEAFEYNR